LTPVLRTSQSLRGVPRRPVVEFPSVSLKAAHPGSIFSLPVQQPSAPSSSARATDSQTSHRPDPDRILNTQFHPSKGTETCPLLRLRVFGRNPASRPLARDEDAAGCKQLQHIAQSFHLDKAGRRIKVERRLRRLRSKVKVSLCSLAFRAELKVQAIATGCKNYQA